MIKVATIVFFRKEGFFDFRRVSKKEMAELHSKGEGWIYDYQGIQDPCCDDLEWLIGYKPEVQEKEGYSGAGIAYQNWSYPPFEDFKWCPYCGGPVEQEIVTGEIVKEDTK